MNRVQALCCATSALALLAPCALSAQTSPQGGGDETTLADGAPAQEAAPIVVTGSRIARRDFSAESPIVTAGEELIKDSGTVSLDATLSQMPQFTSSSGSQTTSTSAAASRAGRANLNLRGLGPSRTLVLLDGKRLPASDASGAVDVNLIPNSLLQSVEVITGGASATYGSDAIAGVVNLKLRRNLNGVILDAQGGETWRGDGRNVQVSAAAGSDFADGRGHAMGAIEYYHRPIITRDWRKRSYFDNDTNTMPTQGFRGSGNLPSQAAVDDIFAGYGVTPPARTDTFYVADDGSLFTLGSTPRNAPAAIGGFPVIQTTDYKGEVTGSGTLQNENAALQSAQTRYNAFGRLEYDLTDNLTVYGQSLFTQYTSNVITVGRSDTPGHVLVSPHNSFTPPALAALLASRPDPDAPYAVFGHFGKVTLFDQEANTTAYQLQVGFSLTDFFRDWTLDVYGGHGQVRTHDAQNGSLDLTAINAVTQAADGGRSLCEGGYDPFTLAPVSQDCKDFLMRRMTRDTELGQEVVEANMQGGLFDLPAGEVRFALGASYRKEKYEDIPSNEMIFATTTGVRPTSEARGSYDTRELYGELLVPLLKDLPLIEELTANFGYRFADYSSIGAANSYKAGLEWSIIPAILVRGGYQRSIRAPSVGDLFAGYNTTTNVIGSPTSGGGDPCDSRQTALRSGPNAAQLAALCQAQGISPELYQTFQNGTNTQPIRTTGNPALNEEKSVSLTGGVVFNPRFDSPVFSALSLSVDYYKIKLTDAIGTMSANVILPRCYNLDGVSNPTYDPNNFYCSLTFRSDSTHVFEYLQAPTINLASYRTWGIDVQLDWRVGLEDVGLSNLGALHLNSVVNYTGEYAIQNSAEEPLLDFSGTIGNNQIDEAIAHPQWKAITSLTHTIGKLSTTLRWRYIGAMDDSISVTRPDAETTGVKATNYFDLVASLGIGDNFEIRGGILNLTDRFPPIWTEKGATDPYAYDLIGRRFYVGARVTF